MDVIPVTVALILCYHLLGHVGSKTLLQQNSPVLNWWCQLKW